jgi:hypothetical protein
MCPSFLFILVVLKCIKTLSEIFGGPGWKGKLLSKSECDTCQKVKASHLKVSGTLQPLAIPSWKWEDISMDFIVGLPNTSQKHDSIWVIIDRLTKTVHFLPVHTTYAAKKYAEIYLDQILRLHGVPKTIISDRGAQFIACFWEQLQSSLKTKLIQSSAYHPQTDG